MWGKPCRTVSRARMSAWQVIVGRREELSSNSTDHVGAGRQFGPPAPPSARAITTDMFPCAEQSSSTNDSFRQERPGRQLRFTYRLLTLATIQRSACDVPFPVPGCSRRASWPASANMKPANSRYDSGSGGRQVTAGPLAPMHHGRTGCVLP